MKRMTAKDFDQELLDLYDYYAHGIITKREFLDQAGRFAVGGVTAAMLLNMLSPDYALAEQVSFNDPDILAEYVTYPPSPNGHGDVRAYQVKPANAATRLPAVWWCMRTAAEPLYRGCGPPGRQGRISGAGAGRAEFRRRLSGQ